MRSQGGDLRPAPFGFNIRRAHKPKQTWSVKGGTNCGPVGFGLNKRRGLLTGGIITGVYYATRIVMSCAAYSVPGPLNTWKQ